MFSRAVNGISDRRRTMTNSKSMPPMNANFSRYKNTSNIINRDLSRRSLSVTHGRDRELEESPSRLSKIMSQNELRSDKKGLNLHVRKLSVSSMRSQNNRMFDRKTSMQSRNNSHRSRSYNNKMTPRGMANLNSGQ